MNEKPKVSIYEVAKESGYSISTVSKALNQTGRIGENTRKKILETAGKLNYIGSYHAKALSQKKSWLIGIVFADNLLTGFSHPYFSVILEHFKRRVEDKGYEVTFINRSMGNKEMSYLDFCKYRNIEGVFVVNAYGLSKQIPELLENNVPVISVDAEQIDVTRVSSDDIKGGMLAAEYLHSLGHKDVFHIAGPLYTNSGRDRLEGFLNKSHELNLNTEIFQAHNYGFEDGYIQATNLIKSGKMPTAVFAAGDWMALGAIKAFKEHNIKIPEEISVLGYDNLDFIQYTSPALTSINQQKEEIGIKCADLLLQQIDGETVENLKLDVNVVERETCIKHTK